MKKRRKIKLSVLFLFTLTLSFSSKVFGVGWASYVIHECRDYDDCPGTDLNWKFERLHNKLQDSGFYGERLQNDVAWPTDFLESSYHTHWFDDWYPYGSDASRTSIYGGHGTSDGKKLYMSYPEDGFCVVQFHEYVRLGTLYGDENALLALFSCCNGLNGVNRHNYEQSRISQVLAFHSTSQIDGYQPRDWFNCTVNDSNKDCWGDLYEVPGGGYQSPSVFTMGKDDTDAYNHHYFMAMGQGNWMGKADETYTRYYYSYWNNGTTCG